MHDPADFPFECWNDRLTTVERTLSELCEEHHAMARQVRLWRGVASMLVLLGLVVLPRAGETQSEPGPESLSELHRLVDTFKHFSRSGNDVFITGANLHIVNGLGKTDTANVGRRIRKEDLDMDARRRLLQRQVKGITVEVVEKDGKRQAQVRIDMLFGGERTALPGLSDAENSRRQMLESYERLRAEAGDLPPLPYTEDELREEGLSWLREYEEAKREYEQGKAARQTTSPLPHVTASGSSKASRRLWREA